MQEVHLPSVEEVTSATGLVVWDVARSGPRSKERAQGASGYGTTDYVRNDYLMRLGTVVEPALVDVEPFAQHKAEERSARLTRVSGMVCDINTAIFRTRDRTFLLQEACRIVHETGHYVCGFIALSDSRAGVAKPIAWFGAGADSWRKASFAAGHGKQPVTGVTAYALSTGEAVVCRDAPEFLLDFVEVDQAAAIGVSCMVSLPLRVDDIPIGAFTLGAAEPDTICDDEFRMLRELAAHLSFALQYLKNEEAVRFLSHFDPLTGLARRSLFYERLSRLLTRQTDPVSEAIVTVLDVEHLGSINDSFGRFTGDRIIESVANALKQQFGDSELLAHLDGGTFAAVMTGFQSYEDALSVLRERLVAFNKPATVGAHEIAVRVKAGLAHYPDDGGDARSLLENAESAMHTVRDSGQRHMRYRHEMSSEAAERLQLEQRLHAAMNSQQFVLLYQPKLSIGDRKIVGAEALLRWLDPDRGLVMPGVFLPVLESSGLIVEVGKWALRKAAEDLRRWNARGLKSVRIAVNVSPLQLRDREFASAFFAAIGTERRGACGLDVEITESALLGDIPFLLHNLQLLRQEGVRVAIDDFGIGYSSLSRLAELPVDILKIDRSFTKRMTEDRATQAVVSTIVSLAKAFTLSTVAEGVETEEQLQMLAELGCQESQGYLHSPAVPFEQFEELLMGESREAG